MCGTDSQHIRVAQLLRTGNGFEEGEEKKKRRKEKRNKKNKNKMAKGSKSAVPATPVRPTRGPTGATETIASDLTSRLSTISERSVSFDDSADEGPDAKDMMMDYEDLEEKTPAAMQELDN
ncbi:hypothetical protein PR003_g21672 [Phytophthora rubi]|uniref:Uncharacterized protein n=2 Tax=Phytophthora rubi TaxID=129364 RepID=A0A6A4DBC9_9STRA|nr:hypothetical protein PR003_g21672 [Phytophthora rubi]